MMTPNFRYERKLWKRYKFVAGADEVGRGCFAGPVVAATVVFAPNSNFQFPISSEFSKEIIVNDSKKLTARQREKAAVWIKQNALSWGTGEISAATINRLGMAKATMRAFRKAIAAVNKKLEHRIQYLLVDAFFIPYIPQLPTRREKDSKGRFKKNPKGRQMAIVDGDEKSLTIGAASIIAKVYRDRIMTSLSKRSNYIKYGWDRNKGYGTKEHQKAIKKYGITRYHRKMFVETFLGNSKLKTNN